VTTSSSDRDAADPSNGYESTAAVFAQHRDASRIGVATVLRWARNLPQGAAILDLGCGSGTPLAAALDAAGFRVYGIDASPTLVAMFRQRVPGAVVACESVEESRFFAQAFHGALAVGLLFLLPASAQHALILRLAEALKPGGRFLFTAPAQSCEWQDALTGHTSRSLGVEAYRVTLDAAGFECVATHHDEGGNHYFDLRKRRQGSDSERRT
jgi:SAM-dependent methyltransferase